MMEPLYVSQRLVPGSAFACVGSCWWLRCVKSNAFSSYALSAVLRRLSAAVLPVFSLWPFIEVGGMAVDEI